MPEKRFPSPVRATKHCRHYSWERGGLMMLGFPKCARGVDLSYRLYDDGLKHSPSVEMCMPDGGLPRGLCAQREEYKDEERAAWAAFQAECMGRVSAAVDALPAPIPLNTQGKIVCPNCGGELRFARWHRGAAIACETENCVEARFSIEAGADWPTPVKKEADDV